MNAFAIATLRLPGKLRQRRAPKPSADEPLAKMQGRDEQGRIKVWARSLSHQPFKQVAAVPNFEQGQLFVSMMLQDDDERRCAIREAKGLTFAK